jgi:iron complex outermembrane receptor protein
MGGILNIITTRPEHSERLRFGGSVEGGYEFNGNSKITRLSMNTSGKTFDLLANGSLRDFGNYKNGEDKEVPTSFKSYDYSFKAGYEPTQNQRIQFGWRQTFGRDILHAGLPMDTEKDNSSIVSLDYVLKSISPKLYSVTFKGFYSYVDHVMSNRNRPNFMMMEMVAPVDATTLGGKLELALTPGAKYQTYLGLDLRHLMRDGIRNRLVKRTMTGQVFDPPKAFTDKIWQDAALNDWGIFIENRLFATEKWTLTAGARLDFVAAELNDVATDFLEYYPELKKTQETNLSANIAADYDLGNGWSTQLALGRGTRTAGMEERFINHFTLGIDAYEYVGNPNLKPEANHQAEWSLTGKGEAVSVKVSAFYSYITNYITAAIDTTLKSKFVQMPKVAKRFQNIDAASQKGFEVEAKVVLLKNFSAYGAAAYTFAENLDWKEPLPEIPPFTATMGAKYENKWGSADFRGRFAAKQDRVAASFGENSTPGFEVFDIRLGAKPLKGLTTGFAVLNIFDNNYYEHLNRGLLNLPEQGPIYEPGRNITLYLKYEF